MSVWLPSVMRAVPKQDAEQKSETREVLVHTDLVLSRLEADIIAKLEHAGERIVQHGNALLAQGEIQHHHLGRYAASKRAMCQLVLGELIGTKQPDEALQKISMAGHKMAAWGGCDCDGCGSCGRPVIVASIDGCRLE